MKLVTYYKKLFKATPPETLKRVIKYLHTSITIIVSASTLLHFSTVHASIIASSKEMNSIYSASYTEGISPFFDQFYLSLTGETSPTNFAGHLNVPVLFLYEIDTSSGAGNVTVTTQDNAFSYTITGTDGTFSESNKLFTAVNPNLASITSIFRNGILVPEIDPAYSGEFTELTFHNPFQICLSLEYQGIKVTKHFTVPEPSSLALLSLGLAGLGFFRRINS